MIQVYGIISENKAKQNRANWIATDTFYYKYKLIEVTLSTKKQIRIEVEGISKNYPLLQNIILFLRDFY